MLLVVPELQQFWGSNCKTVPNLTFAPLVNLHDPYTLATIRPTVCPHTQPEGTCRHFRALSSAFPTHLLRIKCKILPIPYQLSPKIIPNLFLWAHTSPTVVPTTQHIPPGAFGPPVPSAQNSPAPCSDPKTGSISSKVISSERPALASWLNSSRHFHLLPLPSAGPATA